ncbi:IucA/IucC family protein [Streptomyces sp. NPDC005336]|uniref:IucA/IucC family protein n=1 Tax=Streptomyces sp. NPDC005336 TaxID=3157035 RepID=UPI0033A12701
MTETTRAELCRVRPELVEPFTAALPGARAAVLGRLWGAFAREPLPGIAERHHEADDLVVTVEGGVRLTGPAACARRFAQVPEDFTVAGPHGPIDEPAMLLAALGQRTPAARRLAAELDNSVANLALARAANTGSTQVSDSADAEQSVVDGHPQHPCCRTRTGLSVAEVLAYAPEHHPVVDLVLLAVPASRWQSTGDWPRALRDGDTVLVPVHPWQRDHVLTHHPELTVTARTIPARPLLSLRTLAPLDVLPGCHIKTALDVQVTNYRRTISPAEVCDGPPLSDLVYAVLDKTGYGDHLRVLRELGGGSVRVNGGEPSASLAAMIREAGERHLGPGEIAVPLTAVHATGAALVTGDPVRWLTDFADLVLPPALTLLSMGIALEAHGQNTLAVLCEGRPVRVLYRDLDGVRIHPGRLTAHGFTLPPLAGNRTGDDSGALRTKLFGGLLGGVFSELVDVLARTRGAAPEDLWEAVGTVGRRVYDGLPDTGDAAVFFGDTLPLKATIAMRLADDPARAQWIPVPNPLARYR